MNEIEQLQKEIEDLNNQLQTEETIDKLKQKKQQLEAQMKQREFRKKHSGLVKFSNNIQAGTKGFFKGMGKLIIGGTEALNKSDKFFEKQFEEDKKRQENKPIKKDTSIQDALGILD